MEAYIYTRNFLSWLRENNCSILFSTYKKHKLYLMGLQGNGDLSLAFLDLLRPMGVTYDPNTNSIYSSSLGSIHTFMNIGSENHKEWGWFDGIFVPKNINFCADHDIHDVRIGYNESVIKQKNKSPNTEKKLGLDYSKPITYYISSTFNSICMTHPTKSFEVYWTPPFITMNKTKSADGKTILTPPYEDRCHLNGLAMLNGKPKYVTAACARDYYFAWREHHGEGIVVDVETNEVVCGGLWAPHSPTIYNNTLYIGEAGTGQFGRIDLQAKKFVPLKFIPGFIRGITIHNNYALINTSPDRHDNAFKDLPLGEEIKKRGQNAVSGITVLDLQTNDILHLFEVKDPDVELYDITIIPGLRRGRLMDQSEGIPTKFKLAPKMVN